MGGKSESKSSQATTNTNEEYYLNVVDYGEGEAPKSQTAAMITDNSGTVSIVATDQGAIQTGRDIALAGIDFGRGALEETLSTFGTQTSAVIEGALAANRDATEELMGQFMR
jgi:anti-sigma regulatory factor (Ser/Thr protein kinase)